MIRPFLAVASLLALTTFVVAQSDQITVRRNIMKGVGAATRTGTQMSKGDIPFDLAKAQDVLKTYATAADTMHTHFPTDSKTGGETTAAPAIWENQAEFRARFDNWAKDIKQASDQTKDLDTFKTAFGNVSKACGGCHQTFRVKT